MPRCASQRALCALIQAIDVPGEQCPPFVIGDRRRVEDHDWNGVRQAHRALHARRYFETIRFAVHSAWSRKTNCASASAISSRMQPWLKSRRERANNCFAGVECR